MKKRIAAAVCAAALTAALLLFIKPESVGKHYSASEKSSDYTGAVTLEVSCEEIAKDPDKGSLLRKNGLVPDDGLILPQTERGITEDSTAFSVLSDALRDNKIHFDFTAVTDHSAYVKGINNIYEYDCGDLSGWMYSVNGVFPTISASEYRLHDGDSVRWVYTCDLGRDVGDTYYTLNGETHDE